jgi:hypothetical protein
MNCIVPPVIGAGRNPKESGFFSLKKEAEAFR